MAKKCLIKNNRFYTPDGKESQLYINLEKVVGEVEARELFLLSHTPTFKQDNPTEGGQEVSANTVLEYVENTLSDQTPLNETEKLELVALDFNGVETSDDLYDVLRETFYTDGVFSPNIKKMKAIYSDAEIRYILEDVEIQSRIKETIEKLRHTEPFNIEKIQVDNDFSYKLLEPNIIGQFKSNNPLQDKAVYEEANGGEGFTKVNVIDESGQNVETKLIYDDAVKVVDDPNVIRAVDAVINAPEDMDTKKVEDKIQKWMLNYGIDVSNLVKGGYNTLKNFIISPTDENTIALEQALGFERKPKEQYIKISPQNRTYRKLKTEKTVQELFDELSLIKTNTPDIFHQVNKIDEQEMRDIANNQDMSVPEYELYKEYYGYVPQTQIDGIQTNIQTNVEYLQEEFVADFAIEKLKNPNDEFYQQFKITENGIELVSNDSITLAKVKSQIEKHPKLADYSLISKSLPNLKSTPQNIIQTKEDRRIIAVNNKQSIPLPTTEVTILDENFIEAKEETVEFLKIGNDIYEQQEQGIYSKLEFKENPLYYTMRVNAPRYMTIEQTESISAEKEVKKLTDKKTDDENFDCL